MVRALVEEILISAENNGFPFAEVKIAIDSIANENISAAIQLNKGTIYRYDSLELIGNAKVAIPFLRDYLNLDKNAPYSERDIRNIDKKLGLLSFVELKAPTRVFFGYKKLRIQVYLDEKKSDRFDGIIGFAWPANACNPSCVDMPFDIVSKKMGIPNVIGAFVVIESKLTVT